MLILSLVLSLMLVEKTLVLSLMGVSWDDMIDMDQTIVPMHKSSMGRHAAKQDPAAAKAVYDSIFVDPYPSVRETEVAFLAVLNRNVLLVTFDAATAPVDAARDYVPCAE